MFKRLPILFLSLAVPWFAASPASGQVKGAVIVSHDYDAAKNTVTLHMLNQSGKDITAYNVTVKETYSNGQVHEHQTGQEMVGLMLSIADPTDIHREGLMREYRNGTWQAGTTWEQLVGLQAGLALTNFEANVDTVIYANRTADTANPDALKRLTDDRKNDARILEATSTIIRNALANPRPQEAARQEVEAFGKKHGGASGAVLLELENAPAAAQRLGKTLPDYLNDLAAHTSHRAAMMLEQATLTILAVARGCRSCGSPIVGSRSQPLHVSTRRFAIFYGGLRHGGGHRIAADAAHRTWIVILARSCVRARAAIRLSACHPRIHEKKREQDKDAPGHFAPPTFGVLV